MSGKIILAALLGTLMAAPVHAADDAALARMEARINALERELTDLKAEHKAFVEQQRTGQTASSQPPALWQQALVAAPAAAVSAAPAEPVSPPPAPEISVSVDQTGLAVKNNKSDMLIRLRGFVQGDARFLLADGDHNGNDTFEAHRARLTVDGGARGFFYNVTTEFAGGNPTLLDAFAGYRYKGYAVQIGKMKPPVSLEEIRATPDVTFAETGLSSLLMPVRDSGVQLSGGFNDTYFETRVGWQAGIFNGMADNASDTTDRDDGKQGLARIFIEPFSSGIGIGIAGTYGRANGTAGSTILPSYVTTGRQTFFTYAAGSVADGRNWRAVPQASLYRGPVSILADYAVSAQEVRNGATQSDIMNTAWNVQAGWVMTGENATYKSVSPAAPFDPASGQWGAWEIAGRYGRLDIDDDAFPVLANPATAAGGADNWAVVLNGYLTNNARFLLDYEQTSFDGGKTAGRDRETEKALITRAQMQF
jgi:phosphate-selective porin OprO and OprP